MKKLGILLVILAMCLPACGYILVYKLALSATVATYEDDANGWYLQKGTGGGYLVLAVDNEDHNTITTAKYVDLFTEDNELGKPQKYYDIWSADSNFAQTILPGPNVPKAKNITLLDLRLLSEEDAEELTGLALGNNALMDVGTTDANTSKKNIALSLNGSCEYLSGENIGQGEEIINGHSAGTIVLALDSKWTKIANNHDPNKGFDGNLANFLDTFAGPSPRGLRNAQYSPAKCSSSSCHK